MLIDEPDIRLSGVEVRNRPSEYLYYRSIRVQKLRHPASHTYNLTQHISLTEDRTVKYSWEALNIIKQAIVGSTDVEFIKDILTAEADTYETSFDFDDLTKSPGPHFYGAIEDVRGSKRVNESAMRLAREAMRKEMEASHSQELTGEPKEQMARAQKFCEDIGISLRTYTIIVVDGLEDDKTWLVDGRKIFLTPEVFVEGTKALTKALIRATLPDGSVSSVTALINSLLLLGEKVSGEAL